MPTDGRDTPRRGRPLAVEDVDRRQRQQALGGFLQRAVEGLVEFVADDETGGRRRGQPHHGDSGGQPDAEAALQAEGPPHGRPNR